MIFPEIKVIKNKIFSDQRGYFTVNYLDTDFNKSLKFTQDNESYSIKNTFRGMHFQEFPYSQNKLIRVIEGEIIDFIMDVRPNSINFKKLIKLKINSLSKKTILIPKGFAHGFLTLSDYAIFHYKVDKRYSSKHSLGFNIFKNLKKMNIDISKLIMSPTDKNYNEIDNFDYKRLKF